MRTTLIPTDFSLASTKVVDVLLHEHPNETFRIVFFHAFKLSDSITDLLMLNRRSKDYEIVGDDFYESMDQYKLKYPHQLQSIGIEYFYGSTVAAFKNFIEAHAIDCIAYDAGYTFNAINKFSIDPKYLTERVSCETIVVNTAKILSPRKPKSNKLQAASLQESHV